MPSLSQEISLTTEFTKNTPEELNCQPAPKLLLRSMWELGKENKKFTYSTLVNFMIRNKNNRDYYKGRQIRSIKNIKKYWDYAKDKQHNANIPNFEIYFILHSQPLLYSPQPKQSTMASPPPQKTLQRHLPHSLHSLLLPSQLTVPKLH